MGIPLSKCLYRTWNAWFRHGGQQVGRGFASPIRGMGYQHRLITQSGLVANPYLSARYSQEVIMDSHLANLSINGSNFVVAGVRPNRNIVGLGGGLNAQFRQNIDWFMNYNIDLGDRGTNQNAAGGMGFKF